MGERQDGAQVPAERAAPRSPRAALARAAAAGDFQLAPAATPPAAAVRVDQQAAAADAGRVRARRRRRRAVRRQHVPRPQREHHRPVPVHHHRRRAGRRRRRAFPRAPLRELLRARRRDARLGVRQGRAAAHRRLLPGAAAQPARVPPESGVQPVRCVPDAGHLRELLRHDGRPRAAVAATGAAADRRRPRRAGGAAAAASFAGGAPDMFRALQMSGRGPDGYPLDVHPAEAAAAAAGSRLDQRRGRRRWPIAPRCSRTRRRSAACRSAARSRRSCAARSRSSRGPRISFDRRCAADVCVRRCARGSLARRVSAVQERKPPESADADLRLARRRRSRARPVSARRADSPARAGDRVPARRRLVRRHANHRPGLQALLRAGRVRDGVDRIPAHAVGHVSRQRGGRPDRRPMAEGERRRARRSIPIASACGARRPADTWPRSPRSRRAARSRAPTI